MHKKTTFRRRRDGAPSSGGPAAARSPAEAVRPGPGPSLERARLLGHKVAALPMAGTAPRSVQRVVDLNDLDATEHDRYFVDPGHTRKLLSIPDAAEPEPRGLYDRRGETSETGQALLEWTPRVRLVSTAEAQPAPESGQQPPVSATLVEEVERLRHDLPPEDQASLGLLGKNDCFQFAAALQHTIAQQRGPAQQDSVASPDVDLNVAEPLLGVGDRMRHDFNTGAYHGATVVAKDAPDLVTLEAHASKDLRAPEFHLRRGLSGFVEGNQPVGGDVGQNVSVGRLKDLGSDEVDQEVDNLRTRYRRISGEEPVLGNDPSSFLPLMLGLSSNPGLRKAVAMIRRVLDLQAWSEQGKGFFGTKVPGGVSKMRSIVASDGTAREKLTALQQEAQRRWDSPDLDRKIATLDLYHTVRQVDPGNPDFANLTRRLNRVEGRL